MSVAAAGGFGNGNCGGDKKGKGMSTEFPPPLFEEDQMEVDKDPPSYGLENLHSLTQKLSKDKECKVCCMLGQPLHLRAASPKPPLYQYYRDPDDDDFKGRQYSKKPKK